MKLFGLSGTILIIAVSLMVISSGCFSGSAAADDTPSASNSTAVKPKPVIEKVIATTSGTEKAYYAILDIRVKNEGAEGTILVEASVTQGEKTSQNEMDVYLKQGETHEIKLTFPLVWKGGEFITKVQAVLP